MTFQIYPVTTKTESYLDSVIKEQNAYYGRDENMAYVSYEPEGTFRARKAGTHQEGYNVYNCYELFHDGHLFGVLGVGEESCYFDAEDGMLQAHVREELTGDMSVQEMLSKIKYTYLGEYF